MAKAKSSKRSSIRVHFGELNSALVVHNVKPKTTLLSYCESHGLTFGSHIRVNAKVASRETILRNDDIITATEGVNGGRS